MMKRNRSRTIQHGTGWALLAFSVVLAGCGSSRPTFDLPLEPIAYVDTLPSEEPKERELNEVTRLLKVSIGGEIGYGFSLKRLLGAQPEALNVTRFDDVVSSSWYEHRITDGAMSPVDVARGPTTVGPDTSSELTVVAGKAAGISPGFNVRDSRGNTFVIKFDPIGNLHLASAAGVISSRLFHAAGYYTPEDFIVVFDSSRLVLDPEAEIPAEGGGDRRMTYDDIRDALSLTDPLPDGRYLALASKFVPGRPMEPFFFDGVRNDDPNDYYPHQHRRELRGLYVVSSWLNHVDMRYANTLDVFIDPPGYVRHYLIDFAATLGSGTIRPHQPREGKEYNFALWPSLARMVTLGFYNQGWESEEFQVIHPSIGWIPVETFDPGEWRANWPNGAFRLVTPADGYWGAKIVGGFSDAHIRAAVSEGGLPVQEVEDILVEILKARRDKIVAYWCSRVTPIENVSAGLNVSGSHSLEVTFDDLGIAAGLSTREQTRYIWKFKDEYLGVEASGVSNAGSGKRSSLQIPFEASNNRLPGVDGGKATATLHIDVERNGERVKRDAVITLRWEGPETGYRVVGLRH
jgi:hypothetical protein